MSLLAAVPVVDVHCHPWSGEVVVARDQHGFLDRITMLGMCLGSSELESDALASLVEEATDSSPVALAMVTRLARLLGCEPTRAGVGAAREREFADLPGYLRRLWSDAGVSALMMDEGYPQPTLDVAALSAEAGLPIHRVFRIEPAIVELRERAASYDELEDALVAQLERALAEGAVAFKSVIAYRTGLDVAEWSRSDCGAAFGRWRDAGWPESREHAKPVRDALLAAALATARRAGVPVHIHCGGGDPSIVLAHARPADLFPLLHRHIDQPVVLVHSGWPWIEEGAYVASILPRVYLDTSLSTPWSTLAMDNRLELLLGIAPPSKVMYGSDEATEPEVIWLSALLARESLGRVLEKGVGNGWFERDAAARIGAGVLGGNALRLHGLEA